MTREPIYAALFALLAGAATFATTSRRLKHWDDVPTGNQPALFLTQKGEESNPRPIGPPLQWTLDTDVYVYARTDDDNVAASSILNPLIDAICAALIPNNPIGRLTLGGLVEHCFIEGRIETDEGVLGGQSVAIIPIRILTL